MPDVKLWGILARVSVYASKELVLELYNFFSCLLVFHEKKRTGLR
ncbi:hypothetical protein K737_300480 [Holospora undulata HU1]|uniref:Uncharacterized protein n=1 Tax=Holospora undulata HU1 TaxID=1321371 RepID=A0A061JHW7_9PROT|nr:hypothetical protein K737_300480 [Holospora undulata HU1]